MNLPYTQLAEHFSDKMLRLLPIVLEAGQLAHRYFRAWHQPQTADAASSLSVEWKDAEEPVTEADRAVSELCIARLAAAFPSEVVLSEERPDDGARLLAPHFWLVDPIDGTKDFIAGRAGYSVMIGQVTAGEPSLGVVYQPAAERLWLAERDRGAFEIVEDQPLARITVSAIHQIADARMVSSASTREELVEKVRTSAGIRDELQVGSVGVKLCLIASAARDIYMNPAGRCKLWDTAAPAVILQEAGGKLTDLRGSKLRYTDLDLGHHRGLVASNGLLHRDALRVLEPFLVGR